ncbi:MAG: phosphatidylglycerol lysyltransferase [Treponema sp.]|jgi:phosphoglucomutase|nr:phosphatidylglycerol lysyltransferase [Treponema sp.]
MDISKALEGMILSASGWRGVFAGDGGEESRSALISPAHRTIAAAAALVFLDFLKDSCPAAGGRPVIILGADTRPTGRAIAQAMIPALLSSGCDVRYAGVTAAPEIMAYARYLGEGGEKDAAYPSPMKAGRPPLGFIFISASHNPIGHNGIKFGFSDGGVLPPEKNPPLVDAFRAFLADPGRVKKIALMIGDADSESLRLVNEAQGGIKKEARRAYLDFSTEVAFGTAGGAAVGAGGSAADGERRPDIAADIRAGLARQALGIVCDFNGSARTLSIDREFFSSLGIRFEAFNDRPGEIAHRIVPEGESLEPCRLFLEELHGKDDAFVMGYVPDCDGDRGNLVIWDEGEKRARVLEAQEVFALACVAEFAQLVRTGELSYDNRGNALSRAAIAVNDPTSLRIDRIAKAFDVSVFRAEVGEANIVGLARRLRKEGYTVRILGEGSAGGNITHPSAVRDPLHTVLALLKLLSIRSDGERPGLFELWCDLSDQAEIYRPNFTLADIIASLPPFVTTGAYAPEALLRIKTADQSLLKDRYQKIFFREWEERKELLKSRYGICGWEAAAYRGMEEKRNISRFGEAGRGGLKICFINASGIAVASIWMRGSATEPVFRIMADAEGSDKRFERYLIEWQRRMTAEADEQE